MYAGGGYVEPADNEQPTEVYAGAYCSTIYAQGPDLPTTRPGECGTVLVIEPAADAGMRLVMGWVRVLAFVGGLNLIGGMLLLRR